jgi:exodeoxyribonuclease V gamma subunit
VLRVLELADARLTLADVLHVLENEAVQRRFGLFATDVPILRHLCHTAGIRWGLDAETRHARFDVPAFDDNAWRPGLDRLVLGTLTGPADDLVLGALPVGGATDAHQERIARFVGFARELFGHVLALRERRSLTAFADRVDELVHALFAGDGGDDDEAVQQLRTATVALRRDTELAGHREAVGSAVLRDWLSDALAQGAGASGFLGGAVTVAAMLPMRAVPVRCLFVCGLDDASFPRRDRPVPFDLVAADPRPGDRNRRLDDRQLFLDLLLAARERLHLTFVGRSAKDNARTAPSVVLAELLEHVDRTCVVAKRSGLPRDVVTVRHPLQPWSRQYAPGGDPRLFTFARQPVVDPMRAPALPWCPPETDVTGAHEPPEISVDRLLEFWGHPCRTFLREALRVRVPRRDAASDDEHEPFALGNLDRYRLQDAAVRRALRGELPPQDALLLARAQGMLPVGAHGAAAFASCDAEVEQFLAEARQHVAVTRRPIDLELGGVRLTGEIDGVGEAHVVRLRIAKIKPKDRLQGWLVHLLAALQGERDAACGAAPWPRTTRLLAKDGVFEFLPVPPDDARRWLGWLLEHMRIGMTRPLPWFENASFELGKRLHKGDDPDAALHSAKRSFHLDDGAAGRYPRPDLDDADIALCMRDRDPLAEGLVGEFYRLAAAAWPPALGYLQGKER